MLDPEGRFANPAIFLAAVIHLAGAFLLTFSNGIYYTLTLNLTAINLLVTALIVLIFHKGFGTGFLTFLSLGYFTSLLIEIVGVKTGWIFGEYSYGPVLGIKILDTPLLIGLNWVVITYCAGCLLQPLGIPVWMKIGIGCGLLVLLDYFMEPIAMKHNFWTWKNGTIPLQNYVGWAALSLFMMTQFQLLPFQKSNKVAAKIGLIQFGFFLIQNLF